MAHRAIAGVFFQRHNGVDSLKKVGGSLYIFGGFFAYVHGWCFWKILLCNFTF
jgi:hypothetical protein